jgi:uncharacterized repeat protein (TIGR03803 family)
MTPAQNGNWTESVIYRFKNTPDGALPYGNLIFDSEGSLYGTTSDGGLKDAGTVFKLSPNQDETWTESVIYSFQGGTDAANPESGVIFDSEGNLYGAAGGGCSPQCYGTVFKLTPGPNGTWTESLLYTFLGGQDGELPNGVVFDATGNLYGSTIYGGVIQDGYGCTAGCGTVFELTPSQGGAWGKRMLYGFNDSIDGAYPSSGVSFDRAGNLYGEASEGGSLACPYYGCGVVYKLAPESGNWKFSVAHTFDGLNGSKGWYPQGGLVSDGTGNLYGTTVNGGGSTACGSFGCGTIFELSPNVGGSLAFSMIGAFNNVDGSFPVAGVVVDASGNLYGTTYQGGNSNGYGVVFEITP